MARNAIWLITLAGLAACDPAPSPEVDTSASPAVSSPAAPAKAASNTLTCTYPVDGNKDTAQSVLARFGKHAQRATIAGPEGSEFAGLVLWGDDPARKLELIIDDESTKERIFGVTARSAGSRWQVAGLGLGDPLTQVAKANGKAFSLWGFGWDYGGYISDLKNGELTKLPGNCELTLRFDLAGAQDAPDSLYGDTEKQSDDPAFAKAKTVVGELTLNWR